MKKLTFLLIALLIVLSALNACSQSAKPSGASTAPSTPKPGGVLKFADPMGPTGGNIGWPYESSGYTTGLSGDLFLETILESDANGVLKPKLATKFDVSSDLKTITLTLRQGVKFHDGSDWNATVAKWSIDRLINAKISDYVNISSVDILDNYNIRLNVTNYTNSILNTLASTRVVSEAAFDAHGGGDAAIQWMRGNPVGTGPFKYTSFEPNVSLKGVKFSDYWQKGKPYLDGIEMYFIADQMTRAQSLQAGEMDMIGGDLAKVEYDLQQKGFNVIKGYLGPFCLIPDSKNTDSPFSNLKVRQALDYAIDRDAIVKSLGYGFWIPTYQFAIPGTPSYVKDFPARSFDPEKAKQLLTEAGYPNGFKTTMIASAANTNHDVLVAIQGYLSKVGINVDLNMVDMGASTTFAQKGWNNALLCLGKSVDSNMVYSLNTNWTQTCPWYVSVSKTDQFQSLYNTAAATKEFDPALTQKAIRYMYDNAMITTVYCLTRGQVAQTYVHDTGLYTLHNWPFWKPADIWLSK